MLFVGIILLPVSGAPQFFGDQYKSASGRIPFEMSWFEDDSHTIKPAEILDSSGKVHFKPLNGKTSFGVRRSVLWFRIDIVAQPSAKKVFFEIGFPLLDQLDIFLQTKGKWQEVKMGDTLPFSLREISHPNFIQEIELSANKQQTLYLRIQSQGPISVPINVWELASFHTHDRTRALLTGWYFGILLALIVFNLFIYFSVRDLSYLFYIGYLGFISLFLFSTSGLLTLYLFRDTPQIANRLPYCFLYLAIISGLKFAVCISNIDTFLPALAKIIKLYSWFLFMVLLLGMTTTIRFLSLGTPYFGIVALGLGIHTIIVGIRESYYPSYYVGFAYLAILGGGILYALGSTGVIEKRAWTEFAFQISISVEALLLSFALAYRIRYIQNQLINVREEANQEYLNFSKKLIEARDNERRQIATELHDGFGQNLLIIKSKVSDLLGLPDLFESNRHTGHPLQQLIQEAIDDVRGLAHRLHPHILDRLGLREAMIAMVDDAFEGQEMVVQCHIEDISLSKKSVQLLHLYRIVQEGVKNILQHARPVRVEIDLYQSSDTIELRIEDFAKSSQDLQCNVLNLKECFGLSSIRERAELLRGKAFFSHNSSGGFKIYISIPVAS